MNNVFGTGNKLHLIDGSGFIFRAYHALPPLTRSDGLPVGAVAGFCNMIYRLIENSNDTSEPTHLAVVFDHKSKTFRSKIYPNYKANRPPAPDDLIPQFKLIKEATEAFGLPSIEVEGYEADDIIASYASEARKLGASVTILSSDKDLMQLIGDGISMYDTMKNKIINRESVFEKFGVWPEKVIDVQSLAGDRIDNIPGAPGIGIKTAAQLINDFGDLDSLLLRADEIKQPKKRETLIENANQIIISRELVTLKKDAPLPLSFQQLERKNLNPEIILNFTSNMEFRTLTNRISKKYNLSQIDNLHNDEFLRNKNSQDYVEFKKKIKAITYSNFSIINSKEQLQNWSVLIKDQGYFCVDTETTSLNELEANLVGIALSVEPGKSCYIPISHKKSSATEETLFDESPANERKTAVKRPPHPPVTRDGAGRNN